MTDRTQDQQFSATGKLFVDLLPTHDAQGRKLLSTVQAAKVLGCETSLIDAWVQAGRLEPFMRTPKGRAFLAEHVEACQGYAKKAISKGAIIRSAHAASRAKELAAMVSSTERQADTMQRINSIIWAPG